MKLRVQDIATLRLKLKRLRAKAQPRVFERNILFDNAANDIRESGRMLRIRIETPAAGRAPARVHSGVRGLLTYKAPLRGAPIGEPYPRYKEREEIEIEFRPAENLEAILAALGLRRGFRYEKYRTQCTLPKISELHLCLDETPIGNFLELEGAPAAIDRAARLLGFTPQDYITGTYWDLHVADCRGRGVEPGDLVFPNRKK